MGLDRDVVALPASDDVSMFRGEGVEPDLVALAVSADVFDFSRTTASQVSAKKRLSKRSWVLVVA